MAQKSAAQTYRKKTRSGKQSYHSQDRVFRHSFSPEEIFRIRRQGSISCRRF